MFSLSLLYLLLHADLIPASENRLVSAFCVCGWISTQYESTRKKQYQLPFTEILELIRGAQDKLQLFIPIT